MVNGVGMVRHPVEAGKGLIRYMGNHLLSELLIWA